MERIEKTFEVGVPVREAYNQWTQFEDFPRFMEGIEEVRQEGDTKLHWRANVGGKQKEWDAKITEQVPDKVIAWQSTSGAPNGGRVQFESLDAGRTRIDVAMEYEPEGWLEKVGDAMGFPSHRVDKAVEDFKKQLETRGKATGAWRGEIHGGKETKDG